MDIGKKFKKLKEDAKSWCVDHKEELVAVGAAVGGGILITTICVAIEDSKPVTVKDVTDTLNVSLNNAPEPWSGLTMYDDRLDIWIPVRRYLTDEEFESCKAQMEANQDYTLLNYLNERGVTHPYM